MLKAQPLHYHEPRALRMMDAEDYAYMVKHRHVEAIFSEIESYCAEEE